MYAETDEACQDMHIVTGFCVAAREEVAKLRRRAGKLGTPCFGRAPDGISPSSFALRRDTYSSAV